MSNFGFLHLRVVNPYEPAFREARSAVGAASLLADAEQFSNVAEAVADCSLVVGTTASTRRELQHLRILRTSRRNRYHRSLGRSELPADSTFGAGPPKVRVR